MIQPCRYLMYYYYYPNYRMRWATWYKLNPEDYLLQVEIVDFDRNYPFPVNDYDYTSGSIYKKRLNEKTLVHT